MRRLEFGLDDRTSVFGVFGFGVGAEREEGLVSAREFAVRSVPGERRRGAGVTDALGGFPSALLALLGALGLHLPLGLFLLAPLLGRDPRPDRVRRVLERVDADLGGLDLGRKDGPVRGAGFEFGFGELEEVEERVAGDAAEEGVLVLQFGGGVEREEEPAVRPRGSGSSLRYWR